MHQRAALIERGQVERDPELDWGHSDRPLDVRVLGVERRDLGSPPVEVTRLVHLVPHGSDPFGVTHRLTVRGGLSFAVEIAPPQLIRCQSQQRRTAAEDVLDHDHSLRTAEPTEGGVGGLVGLRDPPVDPDVGNPVGVVDVTQGPGEHRL